MLLLALTAYFYVAAYTVMGYMVNDFPNDESTVLLIATIPALVCMFSGFLTGRLMEVMDKKYIAIIATVLNLAGGLTIWIVGSSSLIVCLIAAGVTGFAAGIILTVNYPVLLQVAPEKWRDKVCGWSDAMSTLGMALAAFMAGFLAEDGNWARAYSMFLICGVVLVVVALFYPHSKPADTAEKEMEATAPANGGKGKIVIPAAILAMIFIRFVAANFYMASDYWASDLAINEAALGSSVLVGLSGTVANILGMIAGIVVFFTLRKLKGFTATTCLTVLACSNLLVALYPTAVTYFISKILFQISIMTLYSALSTVVALGTTGKAVGRATSYFVVGTFLGEFLCTYTTPAAARLVFGNDLASSNMIVSAIALLIIAAIYIPVYRKAYKCAFGDKKAQAA